MKHFFLLTAAFLSWTSFGLIEVGDAVPEMCWTDVQNQQVCLSHSPNTVRVLLYNTGWCPDCRYEMAELTERLNEFDKNEVTFISLSTEGWKGGAPADQKFLKEWQTKYGIPFAVAASPLDPGRQFFRAPFFIPRSVVISKSQTLFYKQPREAKSKSEIENLVDDLFAEVHKALTPCSP